MAALRAATPGRVSGFDPRDGGRAARVLLLLEKPGRLSTTVSRDNPTPTARAIATFLAQAGLPRHEMLLWNVVPAWNGTPAVTAAELRAGLADLARLLPLLQRLDAAILAGRHAGRAASLLGHLRVIRTAHPSPNVRAAHPAAWGAIPGAWAEARRGENAARDFIAPSCYHGLRTQPR